MQVMHQSPALGQSLSPTTSAINTASSSTTPTYDILCPSSTSNNHDSVLTSIPLYIKRGHKYHVASACVNCKKAHLACDVSRPCKRCVLLDKTDTCLDTKHKKRGRPKLPPKKTKTPNVGNNTTTMDHYTIPRHSHHHVSDILPTPNPISFCHQPHQGDAPSSPTPFMNRTENTVEITFDSVNNTASSPSETKMTLILSMELCCARISDDTTMSWGYYPQELAHRSMYDFIAVEGTTQLSQLHRRLLDNVMEASSQQDPTQHHQAPPSTERTTSDLFHQKTIKELSIKANGSQSFTDSLIIKTRSGCDELYDVCVYLGGGLGADLDQVSTFKNLYIVMICQKKDIDKLEKLHKPQLFEQTRRPSYKTILPLLAPAPIPSSSLSSISNSNDSPTTTVASSSSLNRYTTNDRNRPIQPKPHDLRQVSLPAHFANNSSLNTISFGTHQTSSKINIAPSSSTIPSSSSSIPYTYFRPIASAPKSKNQPKTLTTIAYHPTSSSSLTCTGGPRKITSIDHPTAQYFSQTSSSKVAQNHSEQPDTTSRKQGMSIRSLLC